jgi:hypothetical protein
MHLYSQLIQAETGDVIKQSVRCNQVVTVIRHQRRYVLNGRLLKDRAHGEGVLCYLTALSEQNDN